MKKGAIFISLLLILNIFSLVIVLAEDVPGVPSALQPDNVAKTQEQIAQLKNQSSSDYLKQEWITILEKNPLGRIIVKIWDFIKPAGKYIFGKEFEISWLFLLTLLIWGSLVNGLHQVFGGFSTFSKGASFIMSLVMVLILVNLGILSPVADFVYSIITSWLAGVIAIIVIALIIFLEILLGKYLKKRHAEKVKLNEDMDRRKLHGEAKAFEEASKGFEG